ncbi:methionyl-tRNA formyltransferase [Ktedonospora formicarum]|uniref:Methionyl-tRNA formyltransferase n=1 Tax=Ktedonospora formicarum TaxID=2778364 RepID=A0A8J3MRL2_9CHLR|nr:methionyl-tRNA formyltransferase [Ktedonospora formicarum]GHO43901.1 methionyl-tRNA formyltransferase [Ktedonospora formicarum]
MLRIIYMGTPQFAVPALEALVQHSTPGALLSEGYEIAAVITRPDKPAGRGRGIIYSPVKQCALAHNLPVWQPGSFKKAVNSEALAAYQADLYIVAAFGQILPQSVLDQPRFGTLNIHASLLPKYRGPDPIAEAILQGDHESGVSIMQLDAGIDTGPVLLRRILTLTEAETTGTLTTRLSELGAQALLEVLPPWIAGQITPEIQDEEHATHTHMLTKEDGGIQWERSSGAIARQVRAYQPWPSAYTHWQGKLLKILAAHPLDSQPSRPVPPGTVLTRDHDGQKIMVVVTGSGLLQIARLQLEGKKAMQADEFLRGYGKVAGAVFGS